MSLFNNKNLPLSKISNIEFDGKINGDVLTWDSSESVWKNSSTGTYSTISGSTDVNFSGLADKQFLIYDSSSSKWVNNTRALYYLSDTTNNFYGRNSAPASITGNNNLLLGDGAGKNLTSGTHNILIGYNSGDAVTTQSFLIGIGNNSLGQNTSGINNIGIGESSLANMTIQNDNIGIGKHSGLTTSGSGNLYIGTYCGKYTGAGSKNVLLGYNIFTTSGCAGDDNCALGTHVFAVSSGSCNDNTACGARCANAYTSGTKDKVDLYGYECAYDLIGGNATDTLSNVSAFGNSIKLGTRISNTCILGNENQKVYMDNTTEATTATGALILEGGLLSSKKIQSSNIQTIDNVSIGDAGNYGSITSGTKNIVISQSGAGSGITDGTYNIAVGDESLNTCTSGNHNIAVGYRALQNAPNVSYMIAIGRSCLQGWRNGMQRNYAIGQEVGYTTNSTQQDDNVLFGYHILYNHTQAGSQITAIGNNALENYTSGTKQNIDCFGYKAGYDTTNTNNLDNVSCIGNNSAIGTRYTNAMILGNSSQVIYTDNTTEATSKTAGSVILSGGISCAKKIYCTDLVSDNALIVSSGGTGQTTYTDGQILIGNSTGNTLNKGTITQGSGITISNGEGTIEISSNSKYYGQVDTPYNNLTTTVTTAGTYYPSLSLLTAGPFSGAQRDGTLTRLKILNAGNYKLSINFSGVGSAGVWNFVIFKGTGAYADGDRIMGSMLNITLAGNKNIINLNTIASLSANDEVGLAMTSDTNADTFVFEYMQIIAEEI